MEKAHVEAALAAARERRAKATALVQGAASAKPAKGACLRVIPTPVIGLTLMLKHHILFSVSWFIKIVDL